MGMLKLFEDVVDGVWVRDVEEVLYYGRTKYQEIAIVRVAVLGKALFIDGLHQSDAHFNVAYHEKMMDLAQVSKADPRVLIVGAGTDSITRAVFAQWPAAHVVGVEIDEEAYRLYRKHVPEWGLPIEVAAEADYRLYFGDAYTMNYEGFVPFDIVFFDIDISTTPGQGMPSELLDRIKSRIVPCGFFVSQAGPLFDTDEDDGYAQYTAMLKKHFPAVLFASGLATTGAFSQHRFRRPGGSIAQPP